MTTTNGRPPLGDVDAEASVLGACLLDPAAIFQIADQLAVADFYRENNGSIYESFLACVAANEPVDLVTVGAALDRAGKLVRIGGRAHLALLQEQVPTAANVEFYAARVREMARRRSLVAAGTEIVKTAGDLTKPLTDVMLGAQDVVTGAAGLLDRGPTWQQTVARIANAFVNGVPKERIPTGLADLDRRLRGGVRPGQLMVVAGRPGMGKTAFGLGVALHVATIQGLPVLVFTLEMSAEDIAERMVAQAARVPIAYLEQFDALPEDESGRVMHAFGKLSDSRFTLYEDAADIVVVAGKVAAAAGKHKLGAVVVDYLQLVKARADSRQEEVATVTRTLKGLAMRYKVPIIALSQLNRDTEKRPTAQRRPTLGDLRESGAIENDADIVLGLFRPHYYSPKEDPALAEVIILKSRNGGTGTVKVGFAESEARYYSQARQEELGTDDGPTE